MVIVLSGIDSTNSITIALSCISNVGPALGGTIGPTMFCPMASSGSARC